MPYMNCVNVARQEKGGSMIRKVLLRGLVAAAALLAVSILSLAAYAYLGDLSPEPIGVAQPVTLNAD